MEITEIIHAWGHKNIKSTHKSTFEITREKKLSSQGSCIIAVSANKAVADLHPAFKKKLLGRKAKMTISIDAGRTVEVVKAWGCPSLILSHPTDIVVRKSDYICSRTLAILADKAACDLSRKIVENLKNPTQAVKIIIRTGG